MSQAEIARTPRPARAAFSLILATYLAIALWLLWRTAILEPFSDMFDWIARYLQYQRDGDLVAYLWKPHNFHHLVWTFGVLDLDVRVFGASSYFFMAVAVGCLTLATVMLARVAAAAAGPSLRMVGAGGAIGFCALGCYAQDVNVDINEIYVHTLVFAIAAILLGVTSPRSAAGPSGIIWRRVGAVVCAVGAGLGSTAGLAVWPALAFSAWRSRASGWLVVLLVCGTAFSLLFLTDQSAPLNPAGGLTLAQRMTDGLALSLDYLGLPWSRGIMRGDGLIGLATLAAMSTALVRCGGPAAARPERIAVALIVFSLATAGMVAIGRNGVGDPHTAPMRYALMMVPAQVGLWILLLPSVRRWWLARPGRMEAAFVVAALVMLSAQGLMALYAVRTADINRRLIADFHAGRRSGPMLTTIYSNLATADALSAQLKAQGRYQRELTPPPP